MEIDKSREIDESREVDESSQIDYTVSMVDIADRAYTNLAGDLWALTYSEPLELLALLPTLRKLLDAQEAVAVYEARDDGASWVDIAGALGRTKQAVQQRYG
jgi:hypothetical protein